MGNTRELVKILTQLLRRLRKDMLSGNSLDILMSILSWTSQQERLSILDLLSNYSAATRCARAYCSSASSATGTIGVKSRCAIHSSRVNLVMWLEHAHSVR